MSDPATQTVEFDRLPPRRARRFVRSTLLRWGCEEIVPDAELLVDELVVNAMVHARGRGVDVTIRQVGDSIRVGVTDPDPDFVVDFRRPDDAPPRFGLRIVDSVAPRWGVDPEPFGKTVWFELDPRFRSDARMAS